MTTPLTDRHRPDRFDAVVGQTAPVTVLSANLRRHRAGKPIPHAFLLAGPHGTGKTTVARIFAEGLGGAVTEIDAAVLSGVDHARDLVERILTHKEPLTVVLDECHSLSRAAWNALLRTMEAPPAGVTLVLVTTDSAALPDTVLSRVVPLRFLPITEAEIEDRLRWIAFEEGITHTQEALSLIARRAAGAMRDAIMAFDQVSVLGEVTEDAYVRVFGAPNLAPAFLDAVADSDVDRALAIAESYALRVTDPSHLAADCIEVLAERLQGSRQPKALLDAIRALWDLQDRLSKTSLTTRATIASALSAVAPFLAQIRDEPPPSRTVDVMRADAETAVRTLLAPP